MGLQGRHYARYLGWAAGPLCALLLAVPARARDRVPFEARAGLDVATAAALAWSHDAVLVYVENDESLNEGGATERWGYLFYSALEGRARGYSIREGRILTAEYLDVKIEAPPLARQWIDSGMALAIAEKKAGLAFRQKHQGTLSTMLLMRGVFNEKHPDQTTWTVVYTAPDAPSLFVVVDALEGKVRRTWRG
jgi:hypothetical protein